MSHHSQPDGQPSRPSASPIVPVRFPAGDLETVEAAREVMGDQTLSAFVRRATIALAKAILAAAADAGIRPGEGGWDRTWIEGELERKPSPGGAP